MQLHELLDEGEADAQSSVRVVPMLFDLLKHSEDCARHGQIEPGQCACRKAGQRLAQGQLDHSLWRQLKGDLPLLLHMAVLAQLPAKPLVVGFPKQIFALDPHPQRGVLKQSEAERLLGALCLEGHGRMAQAFKTAMASAAPGVEAFTAMGRAYVHFALAHPSLFRLMMAQASGPVPAPPPIMG